MASPEPHQVLKRPEWRPSLVWNRRTVSGETRDESASLETPRLQNRSQGCCKHGMDDGEATVSGL